MQEILALNSDGNGSHVTVWAGLEVLWEIAQKGCWWGESVNGEENSAKEGREEKA